MHVFPYSPREGTKAADMPGQLDKTVKTERAERAKRVAAVLSENCRRGFIGRELEVLPEHPAGGVWAAHGRYGFPIYIEGEQVHKNQPRRVRLTTLYKDGLKGEIVE